MRAHFEKIQPDPDRSFHVNELRVRHFDAPWHFHPEVELTLIVESRGRRFVGDSIELFTEGDLVLLGGNLPHFWHNEGLQPRGARAHAIVVHFLSDFLGADLWTRSEFAGVHRLIARAARGLHFTGRRAQAAEADLRALPRLHGMRGLLVLWAVLDRLAGAANSRPLASAAYTPTLDAVAEARLSRVYAFLMEHYTEPLTLDQIARVAAMTPAGFSRYFKRLTRRNVSDFLNDLRISHAAQRLCDTTDSIAAIAAESGFATLSNFNRRFRERLGCAPRAYRQDTEYNAVARPSRMPGTPRR